MTGIVHSYKEEDEVRFEAQELTELKEAILELATYVVTEISLRIEKGPR
jgi:hypothetical protein